jgi:hypothetical protein
MTTNTTIDWLAFIKALIVLGLSLILSVAMIWGNLQYQDYTKNWAKTQKNKLHQIEKEYTNLKSSLKIVNNHYLADYFQLKKEGFFTDKPHLTIDDQRFKLKKEMNHTHLSFLKRNHKLFNYNYDLLAPKPYAIDSLKATDSFKIYQIQTHLKLGLFHEGNFLTFLKRLKNWKFPSLFHLKSCNVKRLREFKNPKDISKPYFQANCILIWYTAKIEND